MSLLSEHPEDARRYDAGHEADSGGSKVRGCPVAHGGIGLRRLPRSSGWPYGMQGGATIH